jgi:hypothetical protein
VGFYGSRSSTGRRAPRYAHRFGATTLRMPLSSWAESGIMGGIGLSGLYLKIALAGRRAAHRATGHETDAVAISNVDLALGTHRHAWDGGSGGGGGWRGRGHRLV